MTNHILASSNFFVLISPIIFLLVISIFPHIHPFLQIKVWSRLPRPSRVRFQAKRWIRSCGWYFQFFTLLYIKDFKSNRFYKSWCLWKKNKNIAWTLNMTTWLFLDLDFELLDHQSKFFFSKFGQVFSSFAFSYKDWTSSFPNSRILKAKTNLMLVNLLPQNTRWLISQTNLLRNFYPLFFLSRTPQHPWRKCEPSPDPNQSN